MTIEDVGDKDHKAGMELARFLNGDLNFRPTIIGNSTIDDIGITLIGINGEIVQYDANKHDSILKITDGIITISHSESNRAVRIKLPQSNYDVVFVDAQLATKTPEPTHSGRAYGVIYSIKDDEEPQEIREVMLGGNNFPSITIPEIGTFSVKEF